MQLLWQPPLPDRYLKMSEDALADAIAARKAELGDRLIILGHHYQQDEVVRFADYTGDSFKLSQIAAERVRESGAEFVVFCGVHFMAESADILTPEDTKVILPDMGAGCSMADMANYDQTVEAWEGIGEVLRGLGAKGLSASDLPPASAPEPLSPLAPRLIPICYMNSSAAIKAFCGQHGGAVCTSSNARAVIEWALAGGEEPLNEGGREDERVKILFLPDQHLGRNTAAEMGFDVASETAVWDPRHPDGLGGLEPEDIERVTFLLWKGHCSVHKLFRPEHVDQIKEQWPDVTVIVHPECAHDVVQRADMSGSTEAIISALDEAEPGSRWAIGTEVHLVNRLAKRAAERGVVARILSECQCLCTTMYRIDPPHLLWVLDELAGGRVVNQITVHAEAKRWALVALDRMLSITGKAGAGKVSRAPAMA